MNNITKEDIANFINSEFGLTRKDCNNFVRDIIEEIILGLKKDNIVKIHNFGTFKIRNKKSRLARNPKSKVEVMIPSRNVISFKPSKHVLKKINKISNES
tara:strand:+ start:530 stop:829 length:300 start_codon:yes stop_codon:yes gene_type:complete